MCPQWLNSSFCRDLGTAMVIAPHPDDDVISVGALMDFMARELGIAVHSVYVTDGSDERYVDIRREEAREACGIIGSSPIFLGLEAGRSFLPRERYLDELKTTFTGIGPDIVFLPAHDCHHTHDVVRGLCLEALQDLSLASSHPPRVLCYEFWSPLFRPDLLFGFHEHRMRRKLEALSAHRSQVKRTDFLGAVADLNRWRALLADEMMGELCGPLPDAGKNSNRPEFAEAFLLHGQASGSGERSGGPAGKEGEPGFGNYDISVFGDIFLDTITSPISYTEEEGTRVVATHQKPGDNAANFSLMAGALGSRVLFMSFLGRDDAGTYLKSVLEKTGNIDFVHAYGQRTTPRTFALTYRDGKRQFLSDFGSNTEIHSSAFDTSMLTRARHFHRAGFFWLESMKTGDNLSLLRMAREQGLETSIDTGTPPESRLELFDDVRSLLAAVDIYFGNGKEICGLAGKELVEKAARSLLREGVGMVVVHGGEDGAELYTPTRHLRARPVNVESENPVGAGDVFNAAFVTHRLRSRELAQSLEFANLAGAYHVAHRERPYPDEDELERWRKTIRTG